MKRSNLVVLVGLAFAVGTVVGALGVLIGLPIVESVYEEIESWEKDRLLRVTLPRALEEISSLAKTNLVTGPTNQTPRP
jgi:hypothetical protein